MNLGQYWYKSVIFYLNCNWSLYVQVNIVVMMWNVNLKFEYAIASTQIEDWPEDIFMYIAMDELIFKTSSYKWEQFSNVRQIFC